MKIAYIVDSTAGISNQIKMLDNVFEMNLTIRFANGDIINDTTEEAKVKEFYLRLKEEKELPTTAQPSPGEYYTLMDQLVAEEYDCAIAIHLSSQLSGTYQTAQMVLEEYQDRLKVAVIDSKATSVVIDNILEQAIDFQNQGTEVEDIIKKIEWLVGQAHIYMMIEDLNNLVKGGRLSSANAFLGGLLQIKPLLEFTDEGEVKLFEKIRTEKKVYARWEEIVEQAIKQFPQGIHVRFAHGDAYDAIKNFEISLLEKFPQILSSKITYLTPVVGVHGGNGVKGIAIIPSINNIDWV